MLEGDLAPHAYVTCNIVEPVMSSDPELFIYHNEPVTDRGHVYYLLLILLCLFLITIKSLGRSLVRFVVFAVSLFVVNCELDFDKIRGR